MLQDLTIILDRRGYLLRDVTVLADRVNAHPVIKAKCNSNYNHSPASELLKLPQVGVIAVQHLVSKLRAIQRKDLAVMIEEKVSGTHSRDSLHKYKDAVRVVCLSWS